MSKFTEKNNKIEKTVVGAYKIIEKTVVGVYKNIETATVSTYKKIENKFVNTFLTKNDESTKKTKKASSKKQNKDK